MVHLMNDSTTPRWFNLSLGLVCALVAISCVGMAVAAMALSEKPAWLILGFEVVSLVAGVVGLLFAGGRFRDASGLTLGGVAVTIAVGAFLAWLSVQGNLQVKGRELPVSLSGWLAARIAAAMLIGLAGAVLVLRRNPASGGYVARSLFCGVPLLIIAGGGYLLRSRVASAVDSLPGLVTAIAGLLLGLLFIVLLSASLHCLIRAFECGRETDQAPTGG